MERFHLRFYSSERSKRCEKIGRYGQYLRMRELELDDVHAKREMYGERVSALTSTSPSTGVPLTGLGVFTVGKTIMSVSSFP